jgi:hypothetical protein
MATYASAVGIATIMLQDQGGGLQPVSYCVRKMNLAQRVNNYSTITI